MVLIRSTYYLSTRDTRGAAIVSRLRSMLRYSSPGRVDFAMVQGLGFRV